MLGRIAWSCFSFAYASANLLAVLFIAMVRDKAFLKSPSKEEHEELQAARRQYWSLSLNPLPGFSHQFFTSRNGARIHYVIKATAVSPKDGSPSSQDRPIGAPNVAIFLHGFPDSYILWKNVLQASSLDSQILIAADLPGYGGSEALKTYGPNDMLEAMTEFILAMREMYLQEEARMVVVSHDWGSVIAARLASEASQLADRWVITSIAIPEHAWSNAVTKVASAKQMLHTYFHHPLRISLLKNALSTMNPVFSQLRRSFYIFIFNLPHPIASIFPTFGNYWFLRLLQKASIGRLETGKYRELTPKEAGEAMASSAGPGADQLDETNGYSSTLKARLPNHGMLEKMRIYREGLFRDPWEKSIETVVALSELPSNPKNGRGGSNAGLFDDGPSGALKAPATMIYGLDDPAFERRLALDGIGDYLTRDSQVLTLKGAGHWLPLEQNGSNLVEHVVNWAFTREQRSLESIVGDRENVKIVYQSR